MATNAATPPTLVAGNGASYSMTAPTTPARRDDSAKGSRGIPAHGKEYVGGQVGAQVAGQVRFRTHFHNTLLDVLLGLGWTHVSDSEAEACEEQGGAAWDLHWADVGWIRDSLDTYRGAGRVNHFRNYYELTRKDLVVKNLKRYRRELERVGGKEAGLVRRRWWRLHACVLMCAFVPVLRVCLCMHLCLCLCMCGCICFLAWRWLCPRGGDLLSNLRCSYWPTRVVVINKTVGRGRAERMGWGGLSWGTKLQ